MFRFRSLAIISLIAVPWLYPWITERQTRHLTINGTNLTFRSLYDSVYHLRHQLIHPNELPPSVIQITGNRCSGRTSHFLQLWEKTLTKDKTPVWYVSADDLQDDMSLLRRICQLYLPEDNSLGDEEHILQFTDTPVTLLLDDYDRFPDKDVETVKSFFIRERNLRNLVIVISGRSHFSTGFYMPEIECTGLSDEDILNILRRKKIRLNVRTENAILKCLRSPFFLRLLLDNHQIQGETIRNSAELINKSLKARINHTAKTKDERLLLEFAVNEVLPEVTVREKRRVGEIQGILMDIILPELRDYMEDPVRRLYEAHRSSRQELYLNFFEKPLRRRLDLLKEKPTDRLDPGLREILFWREATIENYCHAYGMIKLMTSYKWDVFQDYLRQYSDPLQNLFTSESTTAFDRATYFLEMLEEDEENELCNRYPDEMFRLYLRLAKTYEYSGDETERFRNAKKAFQLFPRCSDEVKPDGQRIVSYYIIKTKQESILDFDIHAIKEEAYQWLLSQLKKEEDDYYRSLVYADIGAYELDNKNYAEAEKYYLEAFRLRKAYSENPDAPDAERNLAKINLRRCYVMLGTVYFYMKNYDASIEKHLEALQYGKKTNNVYRYESFSRMVGAILKKMEKEGQPDNTLLEKLSPLLRPDTDNLYSAILFLLSEEIRLMESENCINLKELREIRNKTRSLLKLKPKGDPEGAPVHEDLRLINTSIQKYLLSDDPDLI